LTQIALAAKPDLIIWPETAAPSFLLTDPEFAGLLTGILAQGSTPLLTGSFDKEGDRVYNAAFLFTPPGELAAVYRKMHLVPFGEYIPLRAAWAPILKWVGPADYDAAEFFDLARGTTATIFETAGWRFAVLICFEDTVAPLARRFAQQDVDFLVNLTNDAWFHESPGAEMHLANSLFRAIECRRPLVRATNHGVTAVVDERGVIRTRLDSFTEGSLSYELAIPVRSAPTFYARQGDVFVAGCAAVTVLALASRLWRGRKPIANTPPAAKPISQ
jgi:apolipoprotein N-acyltransferase